MSSELQRIALWALLAVALVAVTWGGYEHHRVGALAMELKTVQASLDTLSANVTRQKAEAAEQLRVAQATADAKQKQIDQQHAQQEKDDASNKRTLDDLRARLVSLRKQASSAGSGHGGDSAAGQAGASADAGAGSAAEAGRLLPGAADPEADDAYDADVINSAYASCRARLMFGTR
jgi:hypothetical protein